VNAQFYHPNLKQYEWLLKILWFQLFEYQRLVEILLHIVSDMEQEGFVQRIGIYLLNSLACQVDGTQKQLLGDLGAMDVKNITTQLSWIIIVFGAEDAENHRGPIAEEGLWWCAGSGLVHYVECHWRDCYQLPEVSRGRWNGSLSPMSPRKHLIHNQ
jgi:hypothetical protein